MRFVFLIGPPGSGKTTQASALARGLGAAHVSAGDLVRDAKAAGEKVPRDREDRSLVDASWIVGRIRLAAGCATDVIVDGFPRQKDHVALIPDLGQCLGIVRLMLPFESALARMKDRGREGEDLQRITYRRFLHNGRETAVINEARRVGLLVIDVDGERDQATVATAFAEAVERLRKSA